MHARGHTHTQLKGKVEGETRTTSVTVLCCHWNQQRQKWECCFLQVQCLTHHLSTGASDCCLHVSSVPAEVWHHTPLNTTPPAVPHLCPVSLMWGCSQISQEGLGAVCLLCKLEGRESEKDQSERKGVHGTERERERKRDCTFKELWPVKEEWSNRSLANGLGGEIGQEETWCHPCFLFGLIRPESCTPFNWTAPEVYWELSHTVISEHRPHAFSGGEKWLGVIQVIYNGRVRGERWSTDE